MVRICAFPDCDCPPFFCKESSMYQPWLSLAINASRLAFETQQVIALRMARLAHGRVFARPRGQAHDFREDRHSARSRICRLVARPYRPRCSRDRYRRHPPLPEACPQQRKALVQTIAMSPACRLWTWLQSAFFDADINEPSGCNAALPVARRRSVPVVAALWKW